MQIFNKLFKHPIILFTTLVISLTVFFNFQLVIELFAHKNSQIPINDGVITEFITETEYKSILDLKNPFNPNKNVFYPFGEQLVFSDSSVTHLPFLIALRPFMDIHKISLLIVLGNIVLANLFMFAFLRRINIRYEAASIGALVFGFSPFISYRVLGHYTYTAHYIFPLLYLAALEFISAKSIRKRNVLGLLLGALLAISFYGNPYYFIMSVLGMIIISLYAYRYNRAQIPHTHREYLVGIAHVLVSFVCILLPWILQSIQYLQIYSFLPEKNIPRSVALSADVFSFILPSEFNPLYLAFFSKLHMLNGVFSKTSYFFFYNWDRFAYPGIIILSSYVMYFLLRKNINKKKLTRIHLFLFLTLFFGIVTMGPFLKIFNRWFVVLDESIPLYFPLPYLILTYIPFINVLTVPARFIAITGFFGSIFSSLLLEEIFIKTQKRYTRFIVFFLFSIFLLDQLYVAPYRKPQELPMKAYDIIASDHDSFSVMEIPFVVRDGLQYIGDVHATSIMAGGRMHGKPFIGGYFPRVDSSVFSYYKGLPFVGHVASIIDKGNYHLYKEEPRNPKITPFKGSISLMKDEVDFLDIKYIILDTQQSYTDSIQKTIQNIGYKEVMKQPGYALWKRNPEKKNFSKVAFGKSEDFLYSGLHMGQREDGFRWVSGKSSTVFLKTYDVSKQNLFFEMASFYKSQSVSIYINDIYIDIVDIHTQRAQYKVPTKGKLHKGINAVTFVFSFHAKPSDVIIGNADSRDLTAQIYTLELK